MDILEPAKTVSNAIQRMPEWQGLSLIAILGFFVGGTHLVLSAHYRRTGRPRKKILGAEVFPFAELNLREWFLVVMVMVCTLVATACIL